MADRTAPPRPLPPQATMGLLDYITAHSLDEDYAHVAAQRPDGADGADGADGGDGPEPDGGRGRRGRRHGGAAVALALFGVLVTTAGVQAVRSEPVRESSREALVAKAQHQRAELDQARAQVVRLRREVERAQEQTLEASESGRILQEQLVTLGLLAGADPAAGPGVRIVVDDNPQPSTERQVVYDKDLQVLVNGLWAAGAEAIAVNGQRLTSLTSIRTAGEAITVNLRSLSRPYTVTAIGDPEQLPARFVESGAGSWWLNLKSVYGLQFTMTREDSLTVPAAPSLTLRHARRPGTERP